MKRLALLTPLFLVALCCTGFAGDRKPDPGEQWAQWRGPLGTGVAPHGKPPLHWSEDRNVRWKTAIPGKGLSTPIVWGNRVFLTTAIVSGEVIPPRGEDPHGAHDNQSARHRMKFVVLALDREDGKILWQRSVHEAQPHESTHETGSWSSPSPVTDGKHLFASFGSSGLFALDFDGAIAWRADPGRMRIKHGHGEGSSPALHGSTLVLNWDHEDQSFLTAFDKRSGKQRWKVLRDEGTSWSTPLIVEHAGRRQVIVSATRRVRAYDLRNGELIWECGGLSGNVVASPVASDGYVYVANSYETRAMLAIRLESARGDITGTDAVAWTLNRNTPYVPSPLLYEDTLYFLRHYQGYLTNLEPQSGRPWFGPQRLDGIRNVYASPVGAAQRVYIVDRDGTTLVLRRGKEFEVLASNRLDDSFSASPAVAGSDLFLRGERFLYRLTETRGAGSPGT